MSSGIRKLVPFGDIDAEVIRRAAQRYEVTSVDSVLAGLALGGSVILFLDTMFSFLDDLGLSPARWRLIVALMFQSDEAGATIGELASHLGVKEPTVTATVDRLEDEGLVRREREPADRRRVRVRLTSEGRALAGRVVPTLSNRVTQLVESMDGVGRVEEMAERIRSGVELSRGASV